MNSWQERVNHLAEHFRKGAVLREWNGDHGFSPEIEAQVRNADPSYCICTRPTMHDMSEI